ncbi:hypothetical protein BJV77DRAFT_459175 [Russula vinacea]|nr:hypothetical protein BJV77DRAFT_459175 [Russula vinacea]
MSPIPQVSTLLGPQAYVVADYIHRVLGMLTTVKPKAFEGIMRCFLPIIGLFVVALATLITGSIRLLVPNSQDISAFYLDNIYRVLAEPNSSSTVVGAPAFLPPNYAIWVNSLWLSSLAICLTSAFLATLLQQWTRRSIDLTQPPVAQESGHKSISFSVALTTSIFNWLLTQSPPYYIFPSSFS